MISLAGRSQTFPIKGQYPSTAYPVCGAVLVTQGSVPLGSTASLPIDDCGDRMPDTNPFYYTFTCYQAGTLGFVLTPNDPADNYDWMLLDITGRIPSDIYNISSLYITGNRSANPGPTGTRAGESIIHDCVSDASKNISTFNPMPALAAGRQYLLLVSHPLPSQSGYTIDFSSGSAILNDPALPHLLSAVISCDNKVITVGISKFVRCNSLATDGSDFRISQLPGSIISAAGLNCNPQFDYNYLEIFLNNPLPPGKYTLVAQSGSDGNTILDDCGVAMPQGDPIEFTVVGNQPTLDSLTPPACSPQTLELVFSSPVLCNSVAADGSDFMVTGSAPVTVSSAAPVCSGSSANAIVLTLSSPIVTDGNYQVSVQTGTDGNTLTNICNYSVPAGSFIPFSIKGTVSADFGYTLGLGCNQDTILLNYHPLNGASSWTWLIDSVPNAFLSPSLIETVFGLKNVTHIVSNGFCSDTVQKSIDLDNTLKARIQSAGEVCPKSMIQFTDSSIGNIISYQWDFGDGTYSSSENPPAHIFPDTRNGETYPVKLIVKNNLNCADTVVALVTKLQSCAIGVPNAFTPNGDGKNDYLYPLNAFTVSHLEFRVYNRTGQLVFESRDAGQKWDGKINGKPQSTGAYIWVLNFTDGSGKLYSLKGSSVLIR